MYSCPHVSAARVVAAAYQAVHGGDATEDGALLARRDREGKQAEVGFFELLCRCSSGHDPSVDREQLLVETVFVSLEGQR
jgi:hypothetical protein